MLKVAQPSTNAFHNIKCGEIYYVSSAVYNVTCCLCVTKMHLDQFPSHFQMQHLSLAEESINLEELERKRNAQLAKDAHLLDNMTIKEKDPEDDPIKQEGLEKDIIEDDKNLQQHLRNAKKSRGKAQNKHNFQTNSESDELNINDELKAGIVAKKPNTRNHRKSLIKAKDLEGKNSQEKKLHESSPKDVNENKKGMKLELENKKSPEENLGELSPRGSTKSINEMVLNEDDELKGYDNGVVNIDRDWSLDDKIWDMESDPEGNKNSKGEFDNDNIDMDGDWLLENKKSETDSDPDENMSKDELTFPCYICKRSYRSKQSLQKHNYNVHNPNKPPKKPKEPKDELKCDECNKFFRSVRDLRGHKSKHKAIICDICGKTFTQTGNMVRHKIRHTGIKAYKCKECDNDFFTDKELKAHMIRHTGHMPFICEICGKRCRDRGVLKAHMRRHTGERPAKCDVCGKSFFSFHDLNVHAVTHSSERPFKCDICGSTFQRKKSLRIHKLIHSKDRKHVCKICGKGFAQSSGLNSHMRTHEAALDESTNDGSQQAPVLLETSYINTENQRIEYIFV